VNSTLPLLAIGFLLIVLVGYILRRPETESGSAAGSSDLLAAQAVPAVCLPPEQRQKELLDRIFGPEDWEFVLSRAPKEVQRLFLRERREIAFCWLSEIRSRAKAAMQFHIAHARRSEKIQALREARLLIDYFLIQAKCVFVAAVLLLRGPIALRKMFKQAGGLSDQLRSLLELASRVEPLANDPRGS
jgi:hypothetical protein